MDVERRSDPDEQHGESAVAYELKSPVNLGQLAAEVREDTGWEQANLVVEGGEMKDSVFAPAKDKPLLLWVTNDEADGRVVGNILRSHEADEGWTPEDSPTLESLTAKVRDGHSMDQVEVGVAVSLLLLERDAQED